MKSKTQTLGKKILVGGATLAMAGSMLATGIVAPFGASAWSSANGKWYSDFNNYAEASAFAEQIAVQIEAESMVLMKNNGVLPLASGVKNISLFGARSYSPVTGGTGSGGGGGEYYTLPQSLENAGYKINPALQTVYANNQTQAMVTAGMWGGRSNILVDPKADVLEEAEYSYILYGDAAIFTIGRSGGEGSDLLTLDLPTHSDPYDHVLSLDDNEKAALEYIKSKFSKVIVLVNCANVMELGELENDEEIDAILWIGQPGNHGLEAVGQVLNGNVNPSGRTVDIYTRNHKLDPTWQNFGLMDYMNDYGDLGHGQIYGSNGSMTSAASTIMNNGYNTAMKSTTNNT
ncbi:MAG: glycoside hydrolase family 3 C-terminal domain-containing protein, partial [Clostridia bacterium]|nr:glycoside hydrolase family 3 C-terminal domain-containing protein [Clostridia bacterium]